MRSIHQQSMGEGVTSGQLHRAFFASKNPRSILTQKASNSRAGQASGVRSGAQVQLCRLRGACVDSNSRMSVFASPLTLQRLTAFKQPTADATTPGSPLCRATMRTGTQKSAAKASSCDNSERGLAHEDSVPRQIHTHIQEKSMLRRGGTNHSPRLSCLTANLGDCRQQLAPNQRLRLVTGPQEH